MAPSSSIGPGTVVRGSVRGDGDLEILGRVEGSVAVGGDLVVGETALVKSDVSGRHVVVRGAIAGNVSAEESLVLEAGARVVGDLGAPRIGIRPGALVRGNVSTQGDGAPRRAAAAAAPPRPAKAPARAAVAKPAPPPRPAARPAPAPVAKPAPAPAPAAAKAPAPAAKAGPPPPVLPSLKKGAKGALKKKGGR